MAELLRRRPSSLNSVSEDSVRVADRIVSCDRYGVLLGTRYETVIKRLSAYQSLTHTQINQAAHALICCRTLAANRSDQRLFQPSYYCRNRNLCRCCYALGARAAATAQLDDPAAYMGMRLLQFVFTSPAVNTKQDEIEWTKRSHNAINPIAKATQAWRRRKGECHRIGHYVIGLHTKPPEGSSLHWPHLHLAIFVAKQCPINSADGLLAWYTAAYGEALGVISTPRVDVTDYGVLASVAVNRNPRGRKVITVKEAANVFAYASRNTEKDDTPETIAARDQLFRLCGIVTSHTRSRRRPRDAPLKKASAPHAFPAANLGKTRSIYYPLDGSDYKEIPPDQQNAVHSQLLAEALADLSPMASGYLTRPFDY